MDVYGSNAAVAPSTILTDHESFFSKGRRSPPSSSRKNREAQVICALSLIITDCMAFTLSLASQNIVYNEITFYTESILPFYFIIFSLMSGYFIYKHHYTDRQPFWNETAQVIGASLMGGIAFIALSWPDIPPLYTFLPFLVFPFIDLSLRQTTKRLLNQVGVWRLPVLLIGEPEACAHAIEVFSSERFPSLRSVGCLSATRLLETSVEDLKYRLLETHGAAKLMLVLNSQDPYSHAVIEHITRTRLSFCLMYSVSGLPLDYAYHSYFSHDGMMMTFQSNLEKPFHRSAKVALDLFVASLILIVISPILAIIYALVRMDGGPAIFGHTRIGRNGRPFRCLKFRTMVMNADAVLADLLAHNPEAATEWAATYKLTSDPRITRIGRILRKTSLDELPQILNVLKLDMSLVGPRPIITAEQTHYGKDIAYYTATRPGITGLWQISGRSDTSYVQRVQLDNWYVRNWSLWRDIIILIKTIPAVLTQKGAR